MNNRIIGMVVAGLLSTGLIGMALWKSDSPEPTTQLPNTHESSNSIPIAPETAQVVATADIPISLENYFNAETKHAVNMGMLNHANNLAEFPTGEHDFGGIKFLVSGMIQLGKMFPTEVSQIKVAAKGQRIHLLHGTGGTAPEDSPVASLVLHYEDGSTGELDILYGAHVRDWWNWNRNESSVVDPHTEIAWWGDNDYARSKNCRIRVFRSTFENPKPDQVITTVDYKRKNNKCAPFLLGLTLN